MNSITSHDQTNWSSRLFHSVGHPENFPVASVLLPRAIRIKVTTIYGLARFADDLADDGPWTIGQRLAFLRELTAMIQGAKPGPWLIHAALAGQAQERLHAWRLHGLDQHPVICREMLLMLSAFSWDARGFWPETSMQFERYCRGSAATVGRMLLALHQIDDAASLHASDALCTALQKINMLQDSGVDAKRGRIYVPACELRALGYDAEHWFRFCSEGSLPEDLRQWIQRQAMAQSEQLRLHQHLAAFLPLRLSWELKAVIAAAASIARALAGSPDPVKDRPRIKTALRGAGAVRLLRDWIFGLGGSPDVLTRRVTDEP
ncbi:MAG: squalene/phytoene synthase family protein [Proteobacteria bacterium]|nr:squalene/phytoene synthase family protein [Pseudomonadota bacterium]